VLCLSFVCGRLSAPSAAAIKEAVVAQVREELGQQTRADLLAAFNAQDQGLNDAFQRRLRASFERAVFASLNRQPLENSPVLNQVEQSVLRQQDIQHKRLMALMDQLREQEAADVLALRQDLETAAATAESDLQHNEHRITQLASVMQAQNSTNPPR
jgi:hypothetical protein